MFLLMQIFIISVALPHSQSFKLSFASIFLLPEELPLAFILEQVRRYESLLLFLNDQRLHRSHDCSPALDQRHKQPGGAGRGGGWGKQGQKHTPEWHATSYWTPQPASFFFFFFYFSECSGSCLCILSSILISGRVCNGLIPSLPKSVFACLWLNFLFFFQLPKRKAQIIDSRLFSFLM